MSVKILSGVIEDLNSASSRCVFSLSGVDIRAESRAVVFSEKRSGSYATATLDVKCGPTHETAYAFPTAVSVAAGPGRSDRFSIDGRVIVVEVGTPEGSAGKADVHLVIIE